MDIIKGDGTLLKEIDLAPANVYQEVVQNIAILLDLIQKSCPMFRDGGLPGQIIGRPLNIAETVLIGYIYDQIEEFEPRAVLAQVRFEENALTGAMIPVVELEGVNVEDE